MHWTIIIKPQNKCGLIEAWELPLGAVITSDVAMSAFLLKTTWDINVDRFSSSRSSPGPHSSHRHA